MFFSQSRGEGIYERTPREKTSTISAELCLRLEQGVKPKIVRNLRAGTALETCPAVCVGRSSIFGNIVLFLDTAEARFRLGLPQRPY